MFLGGHETIPLFEFRGRKPKIGVDCFVASSAEIIGDVEVGDGCYIGPGAKLVADYGKIRIGAGANIEENVVVHSRPAQECVMGQCATIGHLAVLHGCTIGDNAVIGMGAVVTDNASVGEWAAVGEGSVVVSGENIPGYKVAVGDPAKPIKDISKEWKKRYTEFRAFHGEYVKDFNSTLKEVKYGKTPTRQS
jgi:carbonic anhydrase/acetyltransferase-like protein (isoleucine patch superfamily)